MTALFPRRARTRFAAFSSIFLTVAALVIGVGVQPAAADLNSARPVASLSSAGVATDIVKTADLSKFQAGNIISDAVFFNSSTMSAEQIQAFLQARVPSCQSGYTCLKDWYDTSRTTTPDAMCGAYSGGTRERASTIIYKVAQACGINPQVLIATLQKEQSLITDANPSSLQYKIAMGQGCPDTAACDSRYFGFFNQVYGAAWQFKRYANPPGTSQYFTWYAPGKTWNIRWSPNAACGSSPVYIQNQATANLYYYTPYQPNASAIRAGYGIGDACGAYGNRNFYQYFTDWFGSGQGELLEVLQVSGTSERYLVSQGGRWRLGTPEVAAQFTWISAVRDVSRSEIETYQDRGAADRAVRTNTGIVYALDSGRRLRLRDAAQVSDFGWDYAALPVASDAQVARYGDGGWLERVVSSNGASWLVQSGSRRQVVDLGLLSRYGILALSTSISAAMVADYPTSSPVIGAGVYRNGTNYRLQTDGGTYVLPDAASGTALAQNAWELTAESFAYLRAKAPMPVRMTAGGTSYVMLEGGWLEVSAAEYPAGLTYATLPAGATTGLPSAGRVTGPHFIRERSDTQTYLVSGGSIQAVSASDQTWITRTFGVNPRVWVGLDGTIGDVTTPEGLVRTSAGLFYLLDGARVYRLRDCAQVSSWGGNCASLPLVSDTKLAGYANAGTLQALVRTPAGTIWLAQGGRLRQVLDPSILAVYGIPSSTSAVSAATVAKIPVGEPVLGAGVYSDGASARLVGTPAGEYTLTVEQFVGSVASGVRALTAASYAKVTVEGALPSRLRSDGRSFVLTREGWLEVSAAAYGGDAMFTQLPSKAWSGITVAANEQRPHFVKDDASGQEYLVSGGAAQPVSGASERATITSVYGVPPKVWTLVSGALSGIKINHDMIVRDAVGAVYLIDGATRFRMSGCGAVPDFGKDCATLRTLSAAQLGALADGGALAPLLRSADGFVWLVQSGTRREVPDPRVLAVYGIGGAATSVSTQLLAQLRIGPPVAVAGVYDDRAGDVRVVTGDGRAFTVPPASRVGAVISAAWAISPASVDLLTSQGDLPTRISTGSQSFVLTTEGWLAINAADYAPRAFVAIGPRGSEGLPSAGSESRPHFVREQSDSQVYLVSGGLSPVADDATRAWISAAYGVPPKVWVVPNGTLG
ncbi:hypothetical protein ACFM35_08825 [Microbacterium sp. P01]|uniref:hypothetical protein n=1 Tax=Microbacterium sp. P01 TaxID=3366261 RepID=UPI00366E54BE